MFQEYGKMLCGLIEKIGQEQAQAMEAGAALVERALRADGLIYLFGCGHSHMLAEEGFYRAGGLGAVSPVLSAEYMLHEGGVKSSALERRADLAAEVMARYPVSEKDAFVVFSTSGVNGMPVEMARLAGQRGAGVIAVSSGAYGQDPSRHPEGLRLRDVCHVWIDNVVPHGDAAWQIPGLEGKMGPVSTVTGAYILNCLLCRGAERCVQAGEKPAVYVSGNVPGGRERNEAVIARYRGRIRAL